jgi:hypothetical protein
MATNEPVPNLIQYGFGDGYIGADTASLYLGGEERYADEGKQIKITAQNRDEIVAVLRKLADFIESGA